MTLPTTWFLLTQFPISPCHSEYLFPLGVIKSSTHTKVGKRKGVERKDGLSYNGSQSNPCQWSAGRSACPSVRGGARVRRQKFSFPFQRRAPSSSPFSFSDFERSQLAGNFFAFSSPLWPPAIGRPGLAPQKKLGTGNSFPFLSFFSGSNTSSRFSHISMTAAHLWA